MTHVHHRMRSGALPALLFALVDGAGSICRTPLGRGSGSGPEAVGTITVSAAASLTESFTKIGKDFEKKFKGTTVTLNFGASSALVLQITQGAPADVFASADQANMDKPRRPGRWRHPSRASPRNRLEIVVKKGNPAKIESLADLANAGPCRCARSRCRAGSSPPRRCSRRG